MQGMRLALANALKELLQVTNLWLVGGVWFIHFLWQCFVCCLACQSQLRDQAAAAGSGTLICSHPDPEQGIFHDFNLSGGTNMASLALSNAFNISALTLLLPASGEGLPQQPWPLPEPSRDSWGQNQQSPMDP